VKKRSEYS